MTTATPQLVKGDNKITAYQAHARIYCEKRGLNPDEQIAVPHPTLAGVSTHMPRWYLVAEGIYDLALMLRSMQEGNEKLMSEARGPDPRVIGARDNA